MISQRMNALIVTAIGLISASSAHAATDCKALMGAYDQASKLISLEDAQGIGDDSVYRAMLHELKIGNYYKVRELNLTLMQANKCPLPSDPVYPSEYMIDALSCATEQVKGNANSPKCDFNSWKRVKPSN